MKTRKWRVVWIDANTGKEQTTDLTLDKNGDARDALAVFQEATWRAVYSIERIIPVNGENENNGG